MGRPSDLYINEPFRDWSSEIYQEKILSALNFQNKNQRSSLRENEGKNSPENVPDFVNEFLGERLKELRIHELAANKALEELKEGRKKVASREYFELLKQFEYELAKIAEERRDLLSRSGKSNLL